MNRNLINQLAAEKLKEISPELYDLCQQQTAAAITDLNLLPVVLSELFKRYEPTPVNTPFILAVVYKLFAEYKLHHTELRMRTGIRKPVCSAFGWHNSEVVNYYADKLIVYYKGPRWRYRVEEVANEILNTISKTEQDGK